MRSRGYDELDGAQIQTLQTNILGYPLVGCDVRLTANGKMGLTETTFAEEIIASRERVRQRASDRARPFGAYPRRGLQRTGGRSAHDAGRQPYCPGDRSIRPGPRSHPQKREPTGGVRRVDGRGLYRVRGPSARGLGDGDHAQPEAKSFDISAEERKNYVSLTVAKNNYGPTGDVYWFRRVPFDGVGFLDLVNLTDRRQPLRLSLTCARIIAFVAEHRGQYSKTRLRDTQSGKKRVPLRASKADVERAIDAARCRGPTGQPAAHGGGARAVRPRSSRDTCARSRRGDMKPRQRVNEIQAARSPPPAGRHEYGRATQDPCKIRLSAARAQSPARFPLAGDTEPLFSGGFSAVRQIPSYGRLAAFGRLRRRTHRQKNSNKLCKPQQEARWGVAPRACRQLEKEASMWTYGCFFKRGVYAWVHDRRDNFLCVRDRRFGRVGFLPQRRTTISGGYPPIQGGHCARGRNLHGPLPSYARAEDMLGGKAMEDLLRRPALTS